MSHLNIQSFGDLSPQKNKNYKGLMQTGIFFAPIIPQLGFLLFLIHLWLKRSDFLICFKQDISNKINLYVISTLSLLALASAVFTINPALQSIEYLIYVVFIILGYYSIRLSSLSIPDLLKPYIYAVSIETVFGIFQWAFHIEKIQQIGPLMINIWFLDGNRISSLAGHPMVLAGLSAFAFLFSIILFIYYKTNIRYLYLTLGIIAFIAELLTQSRGNFIAMILGVGVLIFFYYRRTLIINTIIIASIIGGAVLFGLYQDRLQAFISNEQIVGNPTTFERFQDKTGSGRVGLWKDSVTLIQNRPLLGYGPNAWQTAMKQLVGDKYGELSDAHNTFLRLSIDFGVPFAMIFVFFVLYKLIKRFISSDKNIFDIGLIASILMIMFLGVVDNPISSATITIILILSAGILWRFKKPLPATGQP